MRYIIGLMMVGTAGYACDIVKSYNTIMGQQSPELSLHQIGNAQKIKPRHISWNDSSEMYFSAGGNKWTIDDVDPLVTGRNSFYFNNIKSNSIAVVEKDGEVWLQTSLEQGDLGIKGFCYKCRKDHDLRTADYDWDNDTHILIPVKEKNDGLRIDQDRNIRTVLAGGNKQFRQISHKMFRYKVKSELYKIVDQWLEGIENPCRDI